jgi:hypothetical protein
MADNGSFLDIKQLLFSQIPLFLATAQECLESIFQKETRIEEQWSVCERLEGEFDHISSIGCANNEYQAIMTTNIDNTAISVFLGDSFTDNDIRDAFGEFCNSFCGLIMDKEPVRRAFGILRQSLPFYTQHLSFFPKAPGVHGRLYIGNQSIYIGYAIRKTVIFNVMPPIK